MIWKDVFAKHLKRRSVVLTAAAAQKSQTIAKCRRAFSVDHVRWQMDTIHFKDQVLFTVVGSTGTGKTKLGVRLAKELGGEVVSADSIQVSRKFSHSSLWAVIACVH